MTEYSKRKDYILDSLNRYEYSKDASFEASNPLVAENATNLALSSYSQETNRPKYDKDLSEILEVVRILNNLAPLRMPIYNFNLEEINGERYYRPDNTLLLVREYDGDIIRDYYVTQKGELCSFSIKKIVLYT